MSYVAPAIKDKFNSLSVDLRELILEQNVNLNSIQDLINVLEKIVAQADAQPS
jgi:hypothetical protein